MCKTLHVISLLFFWDLPKLCSYQESEIFAQNGPEKVKRQERLDLISHFLDSKLFPHFQQLMQKTSHMFYQVFFKHPLMMIQCSMQMQKKPCDLLMQQEQYGTNVPPTTKEEVHIYAYQHNCNNLPTRRREQEDFNNGHKISVQNRVIFHIWGFLLLLVPIVEADKSEDELTKIGFS